jgi:DNA repair protein RadD
MIPRTYQSRVVGRAVRALRKFNNTLIVAPTGAGKTLMLSFLSKEIKPKKVLVLQHRDELVEQNSEKFRAVNGKFSISHFNANTKSWQGRAVFAMVQTLSRPKNLLTIPKGIELLIIDECHHVAAESYVKIVNAVRDINPGCMIAGFTATPMRGDKRGLRAAFDNCADQITLRELIELGFLVPPNAFTIDVGVREELSKVRKLASDYDPGEVAEIMNKRIINKEVVRNWKEKAGDRKTIVFCSTIKHAEDVCASFRNEGFTSECVDGKMPKAARRALLKRFQGNDFQILVNVGVLVEGFDEPTVSCVVLLRLSSFKSTVIQMVGRGLRIVNKREHPGVIKKDCIVLDFGTSLLTHGDIDAEVNINGKKKLKDGDEEAGTAPFKICPLEGSTTSPYLLPDTNGLYGCGAEVPAGVRNCPFCDFTFEKPFDEGTEDDAIMLTEIDLINRSPFRWVDLFGTGKVLVASGFDSFSIVVSKDGDNWHSIGKEKNQRILTHIGTTGKAQAIALADDFLRQRETGLSANKATRWMTEPATLKQAGLLQRFGYNVLTNPFGADNFTKLSATAHLNFVWNRRQIEKLIGI